MTRKVIETVVGTPAIDGAGVHLVRVLGHNEVKRFDPFLMLDAFDSHNPEDYIKGFPMHPHRGIETVSYLIKGHIDHQDSLGNKGTIRDGQSQWMTAGSGILHQEMPQPAEHMLGLQLWINLPKKKKMSLPKYFDIKDDMIKEVADNVSTVKVISGKYKDAQGVKGEHVDALMLDIEVKAAQRFSFDTDSGHTLFIYIVEGDGRFGGDEEKLIRSKTAVLFSKGEEFYVRAGSDGVRFILFSAKPLNEPVSWGGPIVMNAREELEEAFDELNDGTFIKHK